MKNKIVSLIIAVLFLGPGSFAFAQSGGKRIQKLTVGATVISHGTLKVGENLSTKEGQTLVPGTYRVAVAMNSLGEAQFVLSPFKVENITLKTGLEANAVNRNRQEKSPDIVTSAQVHKNTLVKGIASNIEGAFRMEVITPTETLLSFDSNQFSANEILGRPPDSKLIDLRPQESPGPIQENNTITVDAAIALAMQNNRELKAARHDLEIARARLVTASAFPNPALESEQSNDLIFANEGEYSFTAGYTQPFPVARRISRQKSVARVDIKLVDAGIADQQRLEAGRAIKGQINGMILFFQTFLYEVGKTFFILDQKCFQIPGSFLISILVLRGEIPEPNSKRQR